MVNLSTNSHFLVIYGLIKNNFILIHFVRIRHLFVFFFFSLRAIDRQKFDNGKNYSILLRVSNHSDLLLFDSFNVNFGKNKDSKKIV